MNEWNERYGDNNGSKLSASCVDGISDDPSDKQWIIDILIQSLFTV